MLEKELQKGDEFFQREIRNLTDKNAALESDVKKLIEIQVAFKSKNTELFEKNKMLERQLTISEKQDNRDQKISSLLEELNKAELENKQLRQSSSIRAAQLEEENNALKKELLAIKVNNFKSINLRLS
jgi:hypothetical protein